MLIRPDYRVPSFYTKGYWCCESGKLYEFLEILITEKTSPLHTWFRLFNRSPIRDNVIYRLFPLKVKENIASHYNTSPEFMKLILGERLEYTCAFFDEAHPTLDSAQRNKIETIICRLHLSSEHRLLDLGCGWGQIAEAIAQKTGASVTGVNISKKQIEFADRHRSSERLQFILSDYEGFQPGHKFDRIYSIGMLEHVGRGLWGNYFGKISELLAPQGRALVHCIVRRRPGSTNSWIDDQVFPGAYIPQLSEIIEYIDTSGLLLERVFAHDRSNYFETLLAWARNFHGNEQELRRVLVSDGLSEPDIETIMRIWEFYLHGSRLAFNEKNGYCYNVQILLRH
jgi:cyclopropane-fatty-acyl-phospholipid synthase